MKIDDYQKFHGRAIYLPPGSLRGEWSWDNWIYPFYEFDIKKFSNFAIQELSKLIVSKNGARCIIDFYQHSAKYSVVYFVSNFEKIYAETIDPIEVKPHFLNIINSHITNPLSGYHQYDNVQVNI